MACAQDMELFPGKIRLMSQCKSSRAAVSRWMAWALFALFALAVCSVAHAEPWFEAKSPRVTVLTNVSEKRARELALRFEQSRALFGGLISRDKINLAQPLELFAFKDADDFRRSAPAAAVGTTALVAGGERNYLLFAPAAAGNAEAAVATQWQYAHADLARLFLEGSYPPTQPWFDEGLAQYFAGIRVASEVTTGGEPATANGSSLLRALASTQWLPVADLLTHAVPDVKGDSGELFRAESWLLVHYLLSHESLESCGKYFFLVRSQGVTAPEAWRQAFGSDLKEADGKLRAYFGSVRGPMLAASENADSISRHKLAEASSGPVTHKPLPLGADDVTILVTRINEVEARVRVDEMLLHIPERRGFALGDLQNVEQLFPKIWQVHRALGYAAIQAKDFDLAQRDLSTAVSLSPEDPWTRYYRALLRYRFSLAEGKPLLNPGVVQQDLYAALSAYAQFSDALDLLSQAYTAGLQGARAVESAKAAIVLAPRNEAYVLHLGQAYTIAEKWDDAQSVFERLVRTGSPPVATEARKWLGDLPIRRKFGNSLAQQGKSLVDLSKKAPALKAPYNPLDVTPEDEAEDARREKGAHGPDPRPLQFVKGKLVKVDCAKGAAVLTMSAAGKLWHMHVADVGSVVLVGVDGFSCDWRDRNVFVNYRLRKALEGDVSSLELE